MKITNKQIGIIFIVVGILGLIVEILHPMFSPFCIKEGTKTMRYVIYGLVIFIGVKMQKRRLSNGKK